MEPARELWRRLTGLRTRSDLEDGLDDEIRFHIERQTEKNIRAGMAPDEARRAAVVAFGGVERVKEEVRDEVRPRLLEDLSQDARYAVRSLRRSPGFTLAAVLALALGIGANTAIFSAVNGVILRPLPFADPDRLVMLWEENPERGWYMQTAAPANLLDWREQVSAFQDVAGYADFQPAMTLTGVGEPQVVETAVVTGNLFSVLGVRAELGRTLREEETWAGTEPAVVISHGMWTQRFGADPGVVGRTVRLDGEAYHVAGVMPAGFAFPAEEVDVWRAFGWSPQARTEVWFRRAHWIRPVARLSPGVSLEEADAQLQAVVRRLQERYPETNRVMGAGMTPLHEFLVGDTRTPLLVLLGAVGLLLLLACANVGNLLLVRATGRRRELAVRGALGANRLRLARQMVTESLVLSAVGGLLGFALGWAGTRALGALRPPELLEEAQLAMDARVLGYTLAVTVVSGLLFGLAPALWSSRTRLGEALKEGGRWAGPGRGARRAASGLVVLEVALALLLVAGAGLLVRSFWRLQAVDPGFDPRGVLTMTINPPGTRYDTVEELVGLYDELIRRVEALPGVTSAGAVRQLPLTAPSWSSDFSVAGRGPDEFGIEVVHREVVPGYFRTMGVPLLRGRTFTPADGPDAPFVVVINEALAQRYFPEEDPIGQRLTFDRAPDSTSVWRTIVGVVGNEHQGSLAEAPRIEIFAPLGQEGGQAMSLVVRTPADPLALVPAVRRVVAELDPGLAPYEVRTMEEVHAESLARQRFLMLLLLTFAGIALVLAVVGVYGVIAQAARQRTREIGVRVALGAGRGDVLRLVVSQGLALVGVGIAVGLATAVVSTRAMEALLYDVAPTDPLTLVAVALILALAGLAAALLPAREASRTEPTVALRTE